MKKFLIIFMCCLVSAACSTVKYVTEAEYSLDKVILPEGMKSTENDLYISAEFQKIGICLYIKNIGINQAVVDWERSTISDELGNKHRIITSDVRPEESTSFQEPTTIAALEKMQKVIYPRDGLKYIKDMGWVYTPIANLSGYETEEKARLYQKDACPITVSLVINGREYLIVFKAEDKKVGKVTEIGNSIRDLFQNVFKRK